MPAILVVCTANICRSPVVEALLRDRLGRTEVGEWEVASAGTLAIEGYPAAEFSGKVLAERGFDLGGHRSRRVDQRSLAASDLVLCMELGHKEALRLEYPEHGHKIFLLTEMSGGQDEVADPIGGPRLEYVRMVDEVTELIESGLPKIVQLALLHAADRRSTLV